MAKSHKESESQRTVAEFTAASKQRTPVIF
jgi:hypothetical protein